MKKNYLLLTFALFILAPCYSAIIYVTPDGSGNGTSWATAYGSLSTALQNAQSGDEIWVKQGTYKPSAALDTNASFVFKNGVKIYGGFAGTESTLTARADVTGTTTILSGYLSETVHSKTILKVTNALSTLNLLDGFTIEGADWTITGTVSGGGGMQVIGSVIEVRNVTVKDNSVSIYHTMGDGMAGGAGIYGYQSTISLYNVDIINNNLFTSTTVAIPQAIAGGAGIMMYEGTLYYQKGRITLNDVSFEDLYTVGGGGYFYQVDTIYIQDVLVDHNTGTDDYGYGGGLSINACPDAEIVQCIFNSNDTPADGDDLALTGSTTVITNATFSSINGAQPTSLIYLEGSTVSFNNSVFLGQITANTTNNLTYNNCISAYGFGIGTYNNLIAAEMQFVDPGSGNFTPASCSTHLNTANSSLNTLTTDFNGNPRTVGSGMDMGAIELQNSWVNNRVYVDASSVNTVRDGASWTTAFTTVEEALKCGCDNGGVVTNPEVWVAEGTYKPRITNEEHYSTFKLNSNQKIYGGFISGATSLTDRDLTWEVHPTILSGYIEDDYYVYNVITSRYHDENTELNGFIIEDGHATDPSGWMRSGGALFIRDGRPTLKNLWIRNNTADYSGAVYVYDAGVIMDNIKLTGNTAASSGAGMCFYKSGDVGTVLEPTIITNIEASNNSISNFGSGGVIAIERDYNISIDGFNFYNNTANLLGGAIFIDRATLNLSRGVFDGNGGLVSNAVNSGGAFYIQGVPGYPSYITIESVQFSNNVADSGGAINMAHSVTDIINCTFANNTATAATGPNLFALQGSTISVKNSIIDSPANGYPVIKVYPESQATNAMYTLVNSIVTDGFTPIFTISDNVQLNTAPLFVDAANGNYNITACGPAVDAGINLMLELNPALDAAGNPRIKNSIVDLGAFEYQYLDLAFTDQPDAVTLNIGETATFTVVTQNVGITYQWQVSTNNGTTWTNIANATQPVLTVTNVTAAMHHYLYRCVLTDCASSLSSASAMLTVNGVTGVNDVAFAGLALYPNPAKTQFAIQYASATQDVNLTVYDLNGRLIHTADVTAQQLHDGAVVNVAAWANGVYIIQLSGGGQATYKFIKN
ncbi:T9SS type A sorting domain-containing protein [Flavobacterium zepuense]|nr:T9SS type A sorting domain-containing protein [Flavobacterium zepuense]